MERNFRQLIRLCVFLAILATTLAVVAPAALATSYWGGSERSESKAYSFPTKQLSHCLTTGAAAPPALIANGTLQARRAMTSSGPGLGCTMAMLAARSSRPAAPSSMGLVTPLP